MTDSLMSRVRRYGAGAAAILLIAGASGCGGGDSERDRPREENAKGALGALGGGSNRSSDRDERETADRNEEGRPSERNGESGDRTARIGPEQRSGADNFDRRVSVVNNSDQTVTLLRGSPTSDQNWGADRIPSMTLAAGQSTIVDFNDNNGECRYDLQATFSDGSTREQRDVNVCQVREWIVTSDGSSAR